MPHSFSKIWVHGIWTTKNRHPMIHHTIETKIYQLLKNEFENLKCAVQAINGIEDHVHCLFRMNSRIALSDIFQFVKGGTSHTINHEEITVDKFSWQTGFGAFSVSESQLKKVSSYIANQKIHHKKITFEEEYNELLKLHGLPPGY
jgi:putative transposase